jgi:hypothetical protein
MQRQRRDRTISRRCKPAETEAREDRNAAGATPSLPLPTRNPVRTRYPKARHRAKSAARPPAESQAARNRRRALAVREPFRAPHTDSPEAKRPTGAESGVSPPHRAGARATARAAHRSRRTASCTPVSTGNVPPSVCKLPSDSRVPATIGTATNSTPHHSDNVCVLTGRAE